MAGRVSLVVRGPGRVFARPPPVLLSLGVLRALARLVAAVLLAFHLARVARDDASLVRRRTLLGIDQEEGPRDARPDGAGLPARAPAVDVDVGAVLPARGRDLERLADDHARRLSAEVLVGRPPVDDDLAITRPQHHARDRSLPLSGALERVRICHRVLSILQASGRGFCARWGWSGPA